MPNVYVSNSNKCAQELFVDCMGSTVTANGFTGVSAEPAVIAAGALLANKHYPLRATGSTAIAMTLPTAPAIGDAIVLTTVQGVTPYTIGGTVLSIAAPTGQAFYYLKWNGSKWVVSSSRQAYECPGDNI